MIKKKDTDVRIIGEIAGSSDPGHDYITLEKTNGSNQQRLTFGFYPKEDIWFILIKNSVSSGIGAESANSSRRSDIRLNRSLNATEFNNSINSAITCSNKYYDLNDYNCSDYAIDIFNSSQGSNQQLNAPNSNIGFTTPAGLYKALDLLKIEGDPDVSKSTQEPL